MLGNQGQDRVESGSTSIDAGPRELLAVLVKQRDVMVGFVPSRPRM
jgi:hypothetical protein